MDNKKILIIGNGMCVGGALRLHLESRGHEVVERAGAAGLTEAEKDVDLVIFVMEAKDEKVLSVLRDIRKELSVPVAVLMENSRSEDRILGLELGADICMDLSTEPMELSAEVNALLRRCYGPVSKDVLCYGDLELNLAVMRLYRNKNPVSLTPAEFRLLSIMMASPGKVISKQELCRVFTNDPIRADENALMVHMSHLRRKLENDPKHPVYIVNHRGYGYSLGKKEE